jgi:sodium transport system permease protein
MIPQILVVAAKELVDGVRDRRALVSALAASMAGPLVAAAAISASASRAAAAPAVLPVFLLVSAFVAGMSLAIDATAGERERGSFEALLATPATAGSLAAGKWLAVAALNALGVLATLALVMPVFRWTAPGAVNLGAAGHGALVAVLVPLAAVAAALQLFAAMFGRSFKEGQTYLSMLLFVPMVPGMLLAFSSNRPGSWTAALPIVGQHELLAAIVRGQALPVVGLVVAAAGSLLVTAGLVAATAWLLASERIIGAR